MVSFRALSDGESGGCSLPHRKRLRVLNSERGYVDSHVCMGGYGGPVSPGEHAMEGRHSFRGYLVSSLSVNVLIVLFAWRGSYGVFF